MYIYRVVFYNRSSAETWSAGVYAATRDDALAVGAIIISRANKYNVRPDQCQVIEIPSMTSTVLTTT